MKISKFPIKLYKNIWKNRKLDQLLELKIKKWIVPKETKDKTPNILNFNFKNDESNNTICTDVTFIKWKDKFIYLKSVIILGNKKIVGWNLSERNDLNLVMETFKDINLKEYKIVRSNHGYQYASNQFKNY